MAAYVVFVSALCQIVFKVFNISTLLTFMANSLVSRPIWTKWHECTIAYRGTV